MSNKFKIELDDDILKKLKHEDLILILGIQKLSESKVYEDDTSLAEIGKLSFEESTKKNKSNPIVDIIHTKNDTKSEEIIEKAKKEGVIEKKELKSKVKNKQESTKKSESSKNEEITNNLFEKPDLESNNNEQSLANTSVKPELKIFFQILSINQDLSIEEGIKITKN